MLCTYNYKMQGSCVNIQSWSSKLDLLAKDIKTAIEKVDDNVNVIDNADNCQPWKVQVDGLHAVGGVNVPSFQDSNFVVGKNQTLVRPDFHIIQPSFVANQDGCWLGSDHWIPDPHDLVIAVIT